MAAVVVPPPNGSATVSRTGDTGGDGIVIVHQFDQERQMAKAVPSNGIITSAGEYYLDSDRTSVGQYNVRINADNVDLNLNDKIIQYSGPAGDPSIGISASGRNNVHVRNGRIIGSQWGIVAHHGDYLTVDDVDFTGCRYVGVSVSSGNTGARIRRCKFNSITGWPNDVYVIGVNGVGKNALIEMCEFREFYRQPGIPGTGEGSAIILSGGSTNVVIRRNWFENSELRGELDIAVWIATGASATVSENVIGNFGRGVIAIGSAIVSDNTFWMKGSEARSNAIHLPTGEASRNLIVGYDTPISGGPVLSGNAIY
jgi:hypothetical protein